MVPGYYLMKETCGPMLGRLYQELRTRTLHHGMTPVISYPADGGRSDLHRVISIITMVLGIKVFVKPTSSWKESMNVRDITTSDLRDFMGRCYFLRAYFYYKLVEAYGPVPIVPEMAYDVDASAESMSLERDYENWY